MAPKPASTAGKAPASTTSKAPAKSTEVQQLSPPSHLLAIAPKPASTAGKTPASTASEALTKSTEGVKATKKTKDNAPADGPHDSEKTKGKKVRKETYSYIYYKGKSSIVQSSYHTD